MEEGGRHITDKKFKFRELKTYSSTEWLAENKKKYRQVFDRKETTYIYAELSFYNKQFDREPWEVEVELKCYSLKGKQKQLCSLSFRRKVSKYDSIVYIREGWGNKKEGVFWKRGNYYWEAWVEGEKVATKYFYIENPKNEDILPGAYIHLQSLKLYEGKHDDVGEDDRKYYTAFSAEETKYIYSEIVLKNNNVEQEWQCELFCKFYNEARDLKGQIVRLATVKKGEKQIDMVAGWGSNVKGSWRRGSYTVELIFMDRLLAIMPFEVGDEYVEGVAPVRLSMRDAPVFLSQDEYTNLTFAELMKDMDMLIGLAKIKKQLREHASYIRFLNLRKENGFEEKEGVNLHSVFMGNPGTGKTTVAKMMGRLYKKMGVLSKGHIHEVDRSDLVGEYIGQTAPKVKEALEKARGGVLFIDEAYALARANDDSKDFGREVIEILVKEMSNGIGDLAVIVAGYPDEMKHFLDSNPGLKSRFKIKYNFEDYMPQELMQIALSACKQKEVELDGEAEKLVDELIIEAFRKRDKAFGNARFVYDLIEKAKMNLGLRIMKDPNCKKMDKGQISLILADDVEKIDFEYKRDIPQIPVDEKLLEEALSELNSLIGLKRVKESINEMVDVVRYHFKSGHSVLNNFFLHTVFVGNPGTGKTSVARILTKIYKALGILERGHMVETDRQGLVAGYVGQTAIKAAAKIDEAMGGVLFIDEAYALTSARQSPSDFGGEVIQTLLKRMEDRRGEFYVFVAGYPENMDKFLKANPGLSSRFDKVLHFGDYTSEELFQIAEKMLSDKGLHATSKAIESLKKYLDDLFNARDKYFGNARVVRTIVDEIRKKQKLRLAKASKDGVNAKDLVTYEDIKDLEAEFKSRVIATSAIGFKK